MMFSVTLKSWKLAQSALTTATMADRRATGTLIMALISIVGVQPHFIRKQNH